MIQKLGRKLVTINAVGNVHLIIESNEFKNLRIYGLKNLSFMFSNYTSSTDLVEMGFILLKV